MRNIFGTEIKKYGTDFEDYTDILKFRRRAGRGKE